MSSRHLGVISIERFLAVERYRESHPASSTHPLPRPGVDASGRRADPPDSRRGSVAPAHAHHG
jgi:hypothetical protein